MSGVRFHRTIGAVVLAVVIGAAGLLALAIMAGDPHGGEETTEGLFLGLWNVVYDTRAPSPSVVLAAVATALLLAAGVALLERRVATVTRRVADPGVAPLAPRAWMAQTRGVFAGPITVTVLIPAHNEEDRLGQTLASLTRQTRPPDHTIVVADNCTDATVDVAGAAYVEVFESVGNSAKKAGALNQALRQLLPGLGDNSLIMVIDADTILDERFLESAVQRFTDDRALMAVGGVFLGEEGHGLIGQFQRNEYLRYSREIRRRRGRVLVLTGTASIFRPPALRAVAAARGTSIPGTPGDVYDTAALTEDNELTIALKSLGALMASPPGCTVVTELMPTWRDLWRQRLRWQRGALENIGAYGMTPHTMRYWAQQLGIGYGAIALVSYLLLMLLMLLSLEVWIWFPFWLGLGAVFAVERVVTAWRGGARARWLAVSLVPELFYDLFLDIVYAKGIIDISLSRQARWGSEPVTETAVA